MNDRRCRAAILISGSGSNLQSFIDHVARGELEIGFQAVSEILSIEGADLVGTIPEEIQQISTFMTVIPEHVENETGARRLIDFLASPAASWMTGQNLVVAGGQ